MAAATRTIVQAQEECARVYSMHECMRICTPEWMHASVCVALRQVGKEMQRRKVCTRDCEHVQCMLLQLFVTHDWTSMYELHRIYVSRQSSVICLCLVYTQAARTLSQHLQIAAIDKIPFRKGGCATIYNIMAIRENLPRNPVYGMLREYFVTIPDMYEKQGMSLCLCMYAWVHMPAKQKQSE